MHKGTKKAERKRRKSEEKYKGKQKQCGFANFSLQTRTH